MPAEKNAHLRRHLWTPGNRPTVRDARVLSLRAQYKCVVTAAAAVTGEQVHMHGTYVVEVDTRVVAQRADGRQFHQTVVVAALHLFSARKPATRRS